MKVRGTFTTACVPFYSSPLSCTIAIYSVLRSTTEYKNKNKSKQLKQLRKKNTKNPLKSSFSLKLSANANLVKNSNQKSTTPLTCDNNYHKQQNPVMRVVEMAIIVIIVVMIVNQVEVNKKQVARAIQIYSVLYNEGITSSLL